MVFSDKTREGVAKSVINIFLPGGMAHQESFDPKPYAPAEYRGPFGSINTAINTATVPIAAASVIAAMPP